MRVLITSVFLALVLAGSISAQVADSLTDPDMPVIYDDYENRSSSGNENVKDNFDTGLEAGTSFTFSPKNFYGPSYYIAPRLSYRASPRFYLSAGIGLQYSTFYPLNSTEHYNDFEPMFQTFMYASGSYLLTDNLTISGTAYKAISDVPDRLSYYSYPFNPNYQGARLDLDYRISPSLRVGFSINVQDGYFGGFNSQIPAAGYVPVPGF